jgi:hypothetical protein
MVFPSSNSEADPSISNAIDPPVNKEAIIQELEAICRHRQFSSSPKNREFLRYVVSEVLAGRREELKERTLGIKLYKRSLSYDTGSDSVVRVRANDLRKRLTCYYDEHNSIAGWRIHLPRNSYAPVFQPEPISQEKPAQEIPLGAHAGTRKRSLTLGQLMQPTLMALFLCAATFRWEVFSTTPYLDFWTTVLKGSSGITLVLDTQSSDRHDISPDDVNLSEPLQKLALAFHTPIRIESSSDNTLDRSLSVAVHITHDLPGAPAKTTTPDAAYIAVVPGKRPELWIRGRTSKSLQLAVDSISNADSFPYALENALHSPKSLIRISQKTEWTALSCRGQ